MDTEQRDVSTVRVKMRVKIRFMVFLRVASFVLFNGVDKKIKKGLSIWKVP